MKRRDFLSTSLAIPGLFAVAPAANGDTQDSPWYRDAYWRAVIDMHIPDWDERFLSKFDPDQYVNCLVQSRAKSIVCYCQSHVGLFNYPTKIGQQHKAWKGQNLLQQVIDRCHENDIAVVLYTSLIHDRWASDHHPEWRVKNHDGNEFGKGGRHGFVCPNSPYREYVRSWVTEICETFDFEGIRFDMTFWVNVCYCQHCQTRYKQETGRDIPTMVDWCDPEWVTLVRKREQWLGDFAHIATGTVKQYKPNVSVEHQSSTYPLGWNNGVASPLINKNTFLQGDFYGDALQGSFVRKLLENLTPNKPFGYETSATVKLQNHTSIKSEALLEAKASAAIADSAAFIFIDAIDPIGTVNENVHKRLGGIYDRLSPYQGYLGGNRVKDVGIYYSLESKFRIHDEKQHISRADHTDEHTESSMQACRWLIRNHIPYTVITKHSLEQLKDIKVLVLSCVNMMEPSEVDAIRQWVKNGGTLYASGSSSLLDTQGNLRNDFMLSDVFGVSLKKASWQRHVHYIAPTREGQSHFINFDQKYPAYIDGYRMSVSANEKTQILATTTFPWPRENRRRFSSIHSDPPWQPTDEPEIIFHHYGKGKVIYCSSLLESVDELEDTFISLIQKLNSNFTLKTNAPQCVEITLFHQPEKHRYIMSLLNFQKELPNVPVHEIHLEVKPETPIKKVLSIPSKQSVAFKQSTKVIQFVVPKLETLSMYSLITE